MRLGLLIVALALIPLGCASEGATPVPTANPAPSSAPLPAAAPAGTDASPRPGRDPAPPTAGGAPTPAPVSTRALDVLVGGPDGECAAPGIGLSPGLNTATHDSLSFRVSVAREGPGYRLEFPATFVIINETNDHLGLRWLVRGPEAYPIPLWVVSADRVFSQDQLVMYRPDDLRLAPQESRQLRLHLLTRSEMESQGRSAGEIDRAMTALSHLPEEGEIGLQICPQALRVVEEFAEPQSGSSSTYRPGVGVEQEIMPTRRHVPDDHRVTYNTTPPTSGDHWGRWADCGFYESGLPDELIVHNLEHSNIVVSYNLRAAEEVARLRRGIDNISLAARWGVTRFYDRIPEGTVAVATWGVLDVMDGIDEARIESFFRTYAGRLGPERIVC